MSPRDLNPWQVMARRPAPLATLVESETERLRTARTRDADPSAEKREPGLPVADPPATSPQT